MLTITFPAAKYGGLQQRSHTVLAPPGQQADEAFVERVYQVGALFDWYWFHSAAARTIPLQHGYWVQLHALAAAAARRLGRASAPGDKLFLACLHALTCTCEVPASSCEHCIAEQRCSRHT